MPNSTIGGGVVVDYLLGLVSDLMATANSYGVNPIVFLVIYFGSTPFIVLPIYFIGKNEKKKFRKHHSFLIGVLIFGIASPYLYVMLFGHGISIFIRVGISVLILFSVVRVLKKKLGIDMYPKKRH